MISHDKAEEKVLQFVRGELPWGSLKGVGINILLQDGKCEIENSEKLSVKIRASDIARGLLKLYSNSQALKEWATVLLSASSFIDFPGLENETGGDILLSALWDSSFTGSFNKTAFHRAEELVSGDLPPLT